MSDCTLFVCADIEGVSGYVDPDQEADDSERTRRAMTEDVNAAVEGALAERDAEVVVADAHGSKRNLVLEELHPEARLVRGGPRQHGMVAGAENADVAFQVGMHTRPDAGGLLEHVFSGSTLAEVTLNGRPVGEVTLNAMAMTAFGVPTALVTGDDRLQADVAKLLPETGYVTTKEARGMRAATCRPPERVRADIREAAAVAVRDLEAGYPLDIDLAGEIEVRVSFTSASTADVAVMWPGIERESGTAVSFASDDPLTVYSFVRACSKL